ncbi:hypothetical protein SAMN05660297_03226 [Natronincola peptidivorans]|uniref:Uncharacterized protein n=1 Tax=Natronincola peptidivorans TaxID=426128 RepID=A0A1I0GKH2_9FIRM|nr:hypothetical protein [Natronincola peptidivorans]SET70672.1 hypothetical protein SAMN05660297_03226 [Natronincola peptidivorans]
MNTEGFRKLYWGFFFMLSFRIQGFDIIPNIVGYILFFIGAGMLASNSEYFSKARSFSIPMIPLSIFSIYERPAEGGGIHLGGFWPLGALISIASLVLTLLIVYNLFMGIKDMATAQERDDIYEEADKRWQQYFMLQLAVVAGFILIIVPALGIIYFLALFIASVTLILTIMGFMKRCGENL